MEKVSSFLSLFSSLIILLASYFQWYDITYNGIPRTRLWVKIMWAVCILLIIFAIVFLFL